MKTGYNSTMSEEDFDIEDINFVEENRELISEIYNSYSNDCQFTSDIKNSDNY